MDSIEEVGKEDEGNFKKSKKRPRMLGISDLSDDLIGKVFNFLGNGQFIFVAGTSQQFYRVYQTIYENDNDTTMRSAVESISRLEWARANDCPWNWRTCAAAAKSGHLEVLQWARANECPWDDETLAFARENGHNEVFQWARDNGCPLDEDTSDEDAW